MTLCASAHAVGMMHLGVYVELAFNLIVRVCMLFSLLFICCGVIGRLT